MLETHKTRYYASPLKGDTTTQQLHDLQGRAILVVTKYNARTIRANDFPMTNYSIIKI